MKNTPILILIFSANLMHGMGGWINPIENALDYFNSCILKSFVPKITLEQFQKFDFKAAKENLVKAAKKNLTPKNLTPAPNMHCHINSRNNITARDFEDFYAKQCKKERDRKILKDFKRKLYKNQYI